MSRRPLPKLGLVSLTRHHALSSKRPLYASAHFSTVTLPLNSTLEGPSGESGDMQRVRELIRESKQADLMDSLSRAAPNPSRVWGHYIDLLSCLEFEQLPLEIHQTVLRKCVPPTEKLRTSNARRMQAGNMPRCPHMYESRFQIIIRNIRTAGNQPALDDYHFILEQFAAVGHHAGAIDVYKELMSLGLEPKSKTYGLCLQAIAHRQTLPCSAAARPYMLKETTQMCMVLVDDMWKNKISFTSVKLDLAMRILKEEMDEVNFEHLLRIGYGIDLSNPDRPPLEHLEAKIGSVNVASYLPTPLPFSTSALNTIIDALGRRGNVSKLVQAFEVLTVPLPSQANKHFSSSFDDDDDFGVSAEATPMLYQAPYAEPNTTTYNTLIRHLAQNGHSSLVRHYVLQANHLDMKIDWSLHRDTFLKSREEVIAPRFSINRGTLLPAFGLANRNKDMELMRWIHRIIKGILRRKDARLGFYTRYRTGLESLPQEEQTSGGITPSATTNGSKNPLPSSFFTPSTDPEGVRPPTAMALGSSTFPTRISLASTQSTLASRTVPKPVPVSPILALDIDAPLPHPSRTKILDLDLHLSVLQRDLKEISELEKRVEDVIGRTIQRIKERLGRRAWAGKDIYLDSEGARVHVSRKRWTQIVNFQPAPPGSVRGSIESRIRHQTPARPYRDSNSYWSRRTYSTNQ